LQAAWTITQSIRDRTKDDKLREQLIELQGKIGDAQASWLQTQQRLSELLARNRELEQRLTELESWDKEAERYRLVDMGHGTFAYKLREDQADGDPLHFLCPNCFQRREKAILQLLGTAAHSDKKLLKCHSCDTTFRMGGLAW
ncbi:MAG: hypothetical protein ACLFV8_14715, partial [Alphaproteobacteria bacterium]